MHCKTVKSQQHKLNPMSIMVQPKKIQAGELIFELPVNGEGIEKIQLEKYKQAVHPNADSTSPI